MNGQRIVRRTVRTLLKTIFWVMIFVGIGIGTYKITIFYYRSIGKYTSASTDDTKKIVKATTDTVAVNAIFAVDGDEGTLKQLVLEIFNSSNGELKFITIPTKSHYGMSKELYDTLSTENSNVPQIIQWKQIPQYFSQITAYQYACLMLEEALRIHVSFYTMMPESVFMQYFTKTYTSKNLNNENTNGYTLNESTKNRFMNISSSLDMEKELTSYYTKVQSNLSFSERNAYLSSYGKVQYGRIGVYTLTMDTETNQVSEQTRAWLQTFVSP